MYRIKEHLRMRSSCGAEEGLAFTSDRTEHSQVTGQEGGQKDLRIRGRTRKVGGLVRAGQRQW